MSWIPRKTVVVPIDFSEPSAEAIATAKEFTARPADVCVLHVLLPLEYMSPGLVFDTIDDETRRTAAEKHCAEFLAKHGISGVTSTIRFGDPAIEVSEYAKSVQADLIVIPSHGYHGVKRFLLGSVAERVLRHSECPVLVLHRTDA